ncbi:MAG: hypothetical protein M3454_05720 [Actinomycetota bacterium]|nr:hypothetical protein [Actinomycetota bacterium]
MSSGPVRRAHLVAPFGVGSMVTVFNTTAMLAAASTTGYERDGGDEDSRDLRWTMGRGWTSSSGPPAKQPNERLPINRVRSRRDPLSVSWEGDYTSDMFAEEAGWR